MKGIYLVKKIYLLSAVLGTILPYYFLTLFVIENGFNFPLLISELFANNISTFFAVDFLISCIIFLVYMFRECNRLLIKKVKWLCLLALCTVGLSLALPLFLFFRENYISRIE